MSTHRINNVNIQSVTTLTTPYELRRHLPQTPATQRTVVHGRTAIARILDREDPRLLAIVGPCSIHDLKAASEYAQRLQTVAEQIAESVCVVMRVYFEKPRTTIGWKGLINDPYMNESFCVDEGLHMARRFLLEVNALGLPVATEALDPLTPQYIGDLIAWTAIGARTTESQTHRELASGLSTPVGFKNATDGDITVALNAIKAAQSPHHFLGFTEAGLPAVFATTGNPYPHLVLRGGKTPNHDASSVRAAEAALLQAGLPPAIIVDCSHGNSDKQPDRQADVLRDIHDQIEAGNRSIVGFMLESFLEPGSQPFPSDPAKLRYGVSITDACIGWDTTAKLLRATHDRHMHSRIA
ncbi:MAG: 3-deoxy-7-phosphoheptulonate synthase [Kiritimatiellia bacterium]